MNTIKDFPLYYKRILGYIKINVLNDKDYLKIVEGFEKAALNFSELDPGDTISCLYFIADLYMLSYYYEKYKNFKKWTSISGNTPKEKNSNYYVQLRTKYIDLYCRIIEQHQNYSEKILGEYFKKAYKFSTFLEDEDFLYDIMTLNQEILLYDIMTLNMAKGNLHEKLLFCYKYFLEGWNTKLILDKLRKKTLSKIFINFINEYSIESNLPPVVVLCYFYSLEEELYVSTKELTKLNQYFTRIDMGDFLIKTRPERKLFIKSINKKRINIIDKWCNKIREKIVDRTIELLKRTYF